MAGKVFFSVTMSLDGFMAPDAVPVADVFSPEKRNDRPGSSTTKRASSQGPARRLRRSAGSPTWRSNSQPSH